MRKNVIKLMRLGPQSLMRNGALSTMQTLGLAFGGGERVRGNKIIEICLNRVRIEWTEEEHMLTTITQRSPIKTKELILISLVIKQEMLAKN